MTILSKPMKAIVPLMFLCAACNSEEEARKKVEELGCSDIVMTKKDDGSYSFKANCGGQDCRGFVSISGSSSSSSKVCMPTGSKSAKSTKSPSSTAPTTPKKVSTPKGKVTLGKGGVTGFCAKQDVEKMLGQLRPKMVQCYNKDLKKHPSLSGTIPLFWEIGQQGRARHVQVPLGKAKFPVGKCLEQVLQSTQWAKPEQATCSVQWKIALHTEAPSKELGHARLPRSKQCLNPIVLMPTIGTTPVKTKRDIKDVLKQSWRLSSLTGFLIGKEDTLHIVADQFKDVPGKAGPVDGRTTLACHTQNLKYTITTKRSKDGKEVTTRGFSEENSNRSNGSVSLPSIIAAKTGELKMSRRFEGVLDNGIFKSTVTDSVPKKKYTFAGLFKEFEANKKAKFVAVRQGPKTLVLKMFFDVNGFKIYGQGVYQATP